MKYSVEYLDRYVKIIDNNNNEVIASGKVIATKNHVENNGVSIDNKWFFRETKRLRIEVVDFAETKLCDPIKLDLKYQHLSPTFPDDIDVLRDYGYDELDEEIKEYIYRLNDISETFKTTTSCCGHGQEPWYVEFEFSEFWDLSLFINVAETFPDIILKVDNSTVSPVIRRKNIHLQLKSMGIDKDCTRLDRFCTKLEKEFKKMKLMVR